jgi:hypothetical protein
MAACSGDPPCPQSVTLAPRIFIDFSIDQIDQGDTMRLTGTVKKHDTYDGVKQTVVSRCALRSEKSGRTYA